MIEVLWIDDECKNADGTYTDLGQEFIEYAYDEEIKITPMLTYKEGIEAIKKNPLKWCAVILDIHNQNSTAENPSDDFTLAKRDLDEIHGKWNQEEPYAFVLSGNKLYKEGVSLIPPSSYCRKRIYDKSTEDYKLLFEDIHKIQEISTLYKCQKKFFDILLNVKNICGEDAYANLLGIIYKIEVLDSKNEASLLNDMRKILENVMEGLKQLGYNYFSGTNEKESLNNLSIYIGKDESVPIYIQRAFHTIVRVVQNGSHSMQVDSDITNMRAPYVIRSCFFELCNILFWMRSLT